MSAWQWVLLRWYSGTPYSRRVGHDHRRRPHRHVAAQHNLSSEESLRTFLTMVDDKIRSQTSPIDPRLPPDHRDRLYEELSFNPLMRREAHLALTMRHAAGMVFQETHAELSTDPVQKPLIGLATVPGRATDNRAGAYYTPPGLARLLTDLAVARQRWRAGPSQYAAATTSPVCHAVGQPTAGCE